MSTKYYAGIGSRSTPSHILGFMTLIADKLADQRFILRSGGAEGADKAFEIGCDYNMWKNNKNILGTKEIFIAQDIKDDEISKRAIDIASKHHPVWNRLSDFARKLHTRNVFQILGKDLETPVSVVICWTPDGCINQQSRTINTGGTGTAIAIADTYHIPVLNLSHSSHIDVIKKRLNI